VLLQAQGRHQEARAWYADALVIDPRSDVAARNLAAILAAGSNHSAAIPEPDEPAARRQLDEVGRVLAARHDPDFAALR
jgi:Flp pilus assembly protein TadD